MRRHRPASTPLCRIPERRREAGLRHVAIVRVEQLYPFPEGEIRAILEEYPKATEICRSQEEPRNQESWFFLPVSRNPRTTDEMAQ